MQTQEQERNSLAENTDACGAEAPRQGTEASPAPALSLPPRLSACLLHGFMFASFVRPHEGFARPVLSSFARPILQASSCPCSSAHPGFARSDSDPIRPPRQKNSNKKNRKSNRRFASERRGGDAAHALAAWRSQLQTSVRFRTWLGYETGVSSHSPLQKSEAGV